MMLQILSLSNSVFSPSSCYAEQDSHKWGQQDELPVPGTTFLTLLCLVDGVALMWFCLMIFLLTIVWLKYFPSSDGGESLNPVYG